MFKNKKIKTFFSKNLNTNNFIISVSKSVISINSQMYLLENLGFKDYKILNCNDPKHSNYFNPFILFIEDEDILEFCNFLVKDGLIKKESSLLLQALIYYLLKYRPKEEQSFISIMKLLRAANFDENNPNVKAPLDRIFDEVAKRDPYSIALCTYADFKMCAIKNQIESVKDLINTFYVVDQESYCEENTENDFTLNDKLTVFFIIPSESNEIYSIFDKYLIFKALKEISLQKLFLQINVKDIILLTDETIDERAYFPDFNSVLENDIVFKKINSSCLAKTNRSCIYNFTRKQIIEESNTDKKEAPSAKNIFEEESRKIEELKKILKEYSELDVIQVSQPSPKATQPKAKLKKLPEKVIKENFYKREKEIIKNLPFEADGTFENVEDVSLKTELDKELWNLKQKMMINTLRKSKK